MTPDMVDRELNKIAGSRVARLARQLIAEFAGADGVTEAARQMGVDQGQLSKLLSGERDSLGIVVVGRIAENMRLRFDYFFDPTEPINYRDYLRHGAKASEPFESLVEFLESPFAQGIRPEHEAELRAARPAGGDPGVRFYSHLLDALRARDEHHAIRAPSIRGLVGMGAPAVASGGARADPARSGSMAAAIDERVVRLLAGMAAYERDVGPIKTVTRDRILAATRTNPPDMGSDAVSWIQSLIDVIEGPTAAELESKVPKTPKAPAKPRRSRRG